jgi:predicted transposase/invertase (TIGR01784 family)
MSAEERRAYEEFLVERASQDDILQTARTEAEAKGKAEGKRDKARQIAHSMVQEGLDAAIVAKITGLSLSEIDALPKVE